MYNSNIEGFVGFQIIISNAFSYINYSYESILTILIQKLVVSSYGTWLLHIYVRSIDMQRLNGDFLPWNTLYMLNIYSKCFLPLPFQWKSSIWQFQYYLLVNLFGKLEDDGPQILWFQYWSSTILFYELYIDYYSRYFVVVWKYKILSSYNIVFTQYKLKL